jgi:hypothetical protein
VERDEVIRWLQTLSPAALADLLYDVWGDWPRAPADYYDENHMPTGLSRLVMAEVGFWDGWLENHEPPRCEINLIARASAGKPYLGADNLQSGECPRCESSVACWAKNALCPVCGAGCYLT